MTPQDKLTVIEVRRLLASAHGPELTALLQRLADDDRAGVRALVASAQARLAAQRREQERTAKLYALERQLRANGCQIVAGLDEVGRGALAGPLTAAAVVLPESPRIEGLDDSKRLQPARRVELAALVREHAIAVSVAHVSAGEVDALGMTAALRRVMGLALDGLDVTVDHIVLDGLPLNVADNETAVVKGDGSVAAIAAASIVAKVSRDALMRSLAAEHPAYGFEINKGYGTSDHFAAIAREGLCSIHRRSFSTGGGTLSLF